MTGAPTPAALARRTLLRALRGWVSRHPLIYLPLVANKRAFDGTRKAVGKDTELVIEGFPRCGNSFAFAAFRLAQRRPVTIAHHLHAPAQVLAAAKRGIPALVVVRHPDDAIVSLLLRAPDWTPREALISYERFYECIYPVCDRFVVATFDQVVSDFGRVTRRLNDRFGTSFSVFDHTPENVERCFRYLDEITATKGRRGTEAEMAVARPSAAREELKAARLEQLQCPSLEHRRRRATAIHRLYEMEANA